jgi:hypothetical protein
MVGAERFDVFGLPRGKLSGADPAEVVGVVGNSTMEALPNQFVVGADTDPLVPVIAHPPSAQPPLGQELGQVAPECLLGTEDAGRDAGDAFSFAVAGLRLALHQRPHPLVLLAGEKDICVLGVRVDQLDRLSGLLLDRLSLLFGELQNHRRTLARMTGIEPATSGVTET